MPELAALAPEGERRMGANPHANGGVLLRDLRMPDFREYAADVPAPGVPRHRRHPCPRAVPARRRQAEPGSAQFPRFRPGRDALQRPGGRFSTSPTANGTPRPCPTTNFSPRRARDGNAQRAPMRRLARRLPAHRPARPVQLLRGLHPYRRLHVQPARQVAQGHLPACRGGGRSLR